MARSKRSRRMKSFLPPDVLMLIGLTTAIYIILSAPRSTSKQQVWSSTSAQAVGARALDSQYGKVEDAYSRDMETAQSYKKRDSVTGIQSAALKVRDRLKNVFKL